MDEARTGVEPYFMEDPPESLEKQPPYTDAKTRTKLRTKVEAVMAKGYIVRCTPTEVRSLMFMHVRRAKGRERCEDGL
jgi:hypothetical protein